MTPLAKLIRWGKWIESPYGLCWVWTRVTDRDGYGVMKVAGRQWRIHRLAYELLIGPIPVGMQLDHLCRVRRCFNPDHLEPVTARVNTERGSRAMSTHCKRGHEFSTDNTRVYVKKTGVGRACRSCCRTRALAYYHDKKRVSL